MGTEVLRPQDILAERIRVNPAVFHRRKGGYENGNPKPSSHFNRKLPVRPSGERLDQKKRFGGPSESTVSKRSSSCEDLRPSARSIGNSNGNGGQANSLPQRGNHINALSIGQVTILRRGESLSSLSSKDKISSKKYGDDDLVSCGTERIGPDPQLVPKQIRLSPAAARSDVYAGSAFSLSPSPRSLPLPSFFSKNQVPRAADDPATRDLRRLLRLDD